MRFSMAIVAVLVACGWVCGWGEAAVYTVGIGGAYSTVQDAVDDAVAAGGDNFIKIRASTRDERISIPPAMTSGSLVLSGGWNTFFNSQNSDPAATVLDPSTPGSVVYDQHAGGLVKFENLTLAGAESFGSGGGVHAGIDGDARLFFDRCVIRDNVDNGEAGGGVFAQLTETASIEFRDCTISSNTETSDSTYPRGGGLNINLFHSSRLNMSGSRILDNSVENTVEDHETRGAGMALYLSGDAQATIEDCLFRDNGFGPLAGGKKGSSIFLFSEGSGGSGGSQIIEARRNVFLSNSAIESSSQIEVHDFGALDFKMSDSWLAGGAGPDAGMVVWAAGYTTMILNNLTVTGFGGQSIDFSYTGTPAVSLTNTILWANGTDPANLPGSAVTSGNLVGTDPLFVDPASSNFRLETGSPAIDIGDDSPTGGLSETDLHGLNRVIGATVDAGASEWGGLFADDFETGDTRYWQ